MIIKTLWTEGRFMEAECLRRVFQDLNVAELWPLLQPDSQENIWNWLESWLRLGQSFIALDPEWPYGTQSLQVSVVYYRLIINLETSVS